MSQASSSFFCLDEHTIQAAISPGGFLPEEEWERAYEHAKKCVKCRERLAQAQAEAPWSELAA